MTQMEITAVACEAAPTGAARRALRVAALGIAGTTVGLVFGGLLAAILATRVFGYELLTVRSASMEPALSPGDLIVVKPAAITDIGEGDIVLFEAGGERIPTVHRVAGINEIEFQVRDPATGEVDVSRRLGLVTQGDANELPDTREVTASDLRGKVWFSVPGAGELTGLPLQWMLLGFAAASLGAWGAWELRQRGRTT